MKKILKKTFITTAIITGVATSLIPLTSYAYPIQDDKRANVKVTVSPAITLELVVNDHAGANENEIIFSPAVNATDEASFSAIVSSNQPYSLSLSGLNGETAMYRDGYDSTTATDATRIPGTGQIVAGGTSWGVRLASDTNDIPYSPIPETVTKFYPRTDDNAGPAVEAATKFNIGIAIGTGLASGDYSGTLVVTATNN